jgi:hypothetical protein
MTSLDSSDMSIADSGLYCGTSGTTFHERDALAAHYRSDLHRYNLKRKVAGGRVLFLGTCRDMRNPYHALTAL